MHVQPIYINEPLFSSTEHAIDEHTMHILFSVDRSMRDLMLEPPLPHNSMLILTYPYLFAISFCSQPM